MFGISLIQGSVVDNIATTLTYDDIVEIVSSCSIFGIQNVTSVEIFATLFHSDVMN